MDCVTCQKVYVAQADSFWPRAGFQATRTTATTAKSRMQPFLHVSQELRTKLNSVQFSEVVGIWQMNNSMQISEVLHSEVLQATMTIVHKYDIDILPN